MTISIGNVTKRQASEKTVEQYLIQEVNKLGGTAYKFNSENRRAVPDRLCVFPGRAVVFVECKRPGKEPTDAQQRELDRLREKNQLATWVSTKDEVNYLIGKLKHVADIVGLLHWTELREDQR